MIQLIRDIRRRRTHRRNELAFAKVSAERHRERLYSTRDNVIYVDFSTQRRYG